MMKDFSLPSAIVRRGVFCQDQLRGKLTDLTLERCDPSFVFGDDAHFGFFIIGFAAIELRQPQLDRVV